MTDRTHDPEPVSVLAKVESFAKCAACGQMLTRITAQGKRGRKWRHVA